MPLWPFCPRPVVEESLEWNSSVLDAFSRQTVAALLEAPRQGFRWEHLLAPRQYERAQLLMEYAAHGDWQLPVWPERQRITVASGATVVPIDTTASDYRDGGEFLLWQDSEQCELLTIDAIAPDSLTAATPVLYDYTGGYVAPVRTARCVQGLGASRSVQAHVPATVEWVVYDGIDLADAGLYAEYRGYPIVSEAPRIGTGDFPVGVSRGLDVVDSQTGLPYFDTVSSRVARPLAAGWMVKSLADLWARRQFLHALKGRRGGFWLPAWSKGMQLAAPIAPADTTITILAVGLAFGAPAGDIMLQALDGTQRYRQYTAAAPSGPYEVLTLAAPAGFTMAPAGVRRLCRLHFCRALSDRVNMTHEHLGRGQLSTILLPAVEVPWTAPP